MAETLTRPIPDAYQGDPANSDFLREDIPKFEIPQENPLFDQQTEANIAEEKTYQAQSPESIATPEELREMISHNGLFVTWARQNALTLSDN